jgi:hypothetical protein
MSECNPSHGICKCRRETIEINEYEVRKSEASKWITANKITFYNQGNIPVYVGLIKVMPGDSHQVNYEHPHLIRRVFPIRFVTDAIPVSSDIQEEFGLEDNPLLIVQTMTPILS